MKIKTLLTTAAVAGMTLAAPAFAQDAGNVLLQLNTVQDTGESCRVTYVAQNGTNSDLKQLSYEMAVFNERGAVSKLLIMEFGALDSGKTRVSQFDLDGESCGNISKILVNNQIDCSTAEGPSNVCVSGLVAEQLDTTIEFTN